MVRVSTGEETVPNALRLLQVVHDDAAYTEVAIRHLDRHVLGNAPTELGDRLRQANHALWSTIANLADVHAQILQAAGRWDEAAAVKLAPFRHQEDLPDDGRYGFRDYIDVLSDSVIETSHRYNAFWAAAGVWAAKGGSFSDAYKQQYDEIGRDTAGIQPLLRGGTQVALAVILKPAQIIVDLANMPADYRERYEAAGLRCCSKMARATSAATATAVREGIGKAIEGILPKSSAGKAAAYLAGASEDDQEAFARGIGDIYGAIVDAEAGHPETADKVAEAIREGQYGEILRESATQPEDLRELLHIITPVEATVVPGTPSDRDRPAYAPNPATA